jgi:nicotinate-nucleotide adenylyltransferase
MVFIPAGLPWMKREGELTSKNHRREMVQRAIAGDPRFSCSSIELDRPGETYTVDTLEELRAGDMVSDELLLVMGVDTLNTMHRWKNPGRILEIARLAVAIRPGHQGMDLRELEAIDPTAGERIMSVRMPLIEISGTELRRRVRVGEPVRYLVPTAVAEYIEEHGLYRGDRTTALAGTGA